MSKILRNDTISNITISDTGVTIQPGVANQYTIPPQEYLLWAGSSDVIIEIGAGNIVVNDGSNDLSINDGTKLIQGLFPNPVGLASGDDLTPIGHVGDSLKVIGGTGGVGIDPITGRDVFFRPDILKDGSNADMAVNPTTAKKEKFKLQFEDDTGNSSYNGTYFVFFDGPNDPADKYYVWYTDGGATDPAPGGTGIQVNYGAYDDAGLIRDNTKTAIDASTADVTVTNPTWNTLQIEVNTTGDVEDATITAPTNRVKFNGPYTQGSDGSAAIYEWAPDNADTWYMTGLSVILIDPGTMSPTNFGSISALTNGIKIEIKQHGITREFALIKNNLEMSLAFAGIAGNSNSEGVGSGWLNDQDQFRAYVDFSPGMVLRGSHADVVKVTIQDNLNALEHLCMAIHKWKVIA